MSTLALLGGTPALQREMATFNAIGAEEARLVQSVLETGVLSKFVGAWCEDFFGGTYVQQLEQDWCARFGCAHAVSMNSATSGLFAAVAAVGVSPGDEVIVPPYTMSATVMAPLIYGGIPVFADIEPETFCIDIESVCDNITDRTRAIIAVNLFGHPARLHELRKLADEHGIFLIEDNAQAPLASEAGHLAGTIGHIGVFSLNRHKHIQTGEGALCTTDDETLARRLEMIRNHAENLTEPLEVQDITNLVGFNYRMTELTAAVGVAQLAAADRIIDERCRIAEFLTKNAAGLPGLTPPAVREGCRHAYYAWTAKIDEAVTGVPRALIAEALNAEGFIVSEGYVKPLYMLPVFQKRVAIGRDGWPFTLTNRTYPQGLCPVAERMHNHEVIEFPVCAFTPTDAQIEELVAGLHKVFDNLPALREAHAGRAR